MSVDGTVVIGIVASDVVELYIRNSGNTTTSPASISTSHRHFYPLMRLQVCKKRSDQTLLFCCLLG
ncbi:MAG: hypothetical protein R3C12_13125 [Planctomycetaceae bacterium]